MNVLEAAIQLKAILGCTIMRAVQYLQEIKP